MARALAKKLVGCGLDVWWDQDGIEGGHNFTAEIVEAIIRQYYFLLMGIRLTQVAPISCGLGIFLGSVTG